MKNQVFHMLQFVRLFEYSDLPYVHTTTIGNTLRNKLTENWTRKRLTRHSSDKFRPENIAYAQGYLDYMSTVDPFRVKFYDECGFAFPDTTSGKYGHSPEGEPCVEIGRNIYHPNVSLMLLIGLEGLLYGNTVHDSVETLEFLNFWGENAEVLGPYGTPTLDYGDILVMDNAAIHHNVGGFIIAEYLDETEVDVIYLPTYSPEMNPFELVFNKLQCISKQDELKDMYQQSIDVGIYNSLSQVTEQDIFNFYKQVDYLNLPRCMNNVNHSEQIWILSKVVIGFSTPMSFIQVYYLVTFGCCCFL